MVGVWEGGLTAQLLEDLLDVWGGTRHLVVESAPGLGFVDNSVDVESWSREHV